MLSIKAARFLIGAACLLVAVELSSADSPKEIETSKLNATVEVSSADLAKEIKTDKLDEKVELPSADLAKKVKTYKVDEEVELPSAKLAKAFKANKLKEKCFSDLAKRLKVLKIPAKVKSLVKAIKENPATNFPMIDGAERVYLNMFYDKNQCSEYEKNIQAVIKETSEHNRCKLLPDHIDTKAGLTRAVMNSPKHMSPYIICQVMALDNEQ